MHPNFAGALVNGALYLIGVVALAIVTNNRFAAGMALWACGLAYCSHVIHFVWAGDDRGRAVGNGFVAISVVAAGWAGWAVLFR